jgi:hypothetical protein
MVVVSPQLPGVDFWPEMKPLGDNHPTTRVAGRKTEPDFASGRSEESAGATDKG